MSDWPPFQGEPLDKVFINELDLDTRVWDVLISNGYVFVNDVVSTTAEQLLAIRGFGRKSLENVIDRLDYHGLSLSQD